MKSIKDAFDIVLGTNDGKTGGYYLAGFIFCGMALLLSLYISSKKRDPASSNTPPHFSMLFMIWDNAKRAGATLILEFILFRIFDLSNVIAMVGVGFFVAAGLDQAIEWLMKHTNFLNFLQSNRDKFPTIPKNDA